MGAGRAGGAGWRGAGAGRLGLGASGRGAALQPRARWRRVLRHSPTLGPGDAAAGALPSRGGSTPSAPSSAPAPRRKPSRMGRGAGDPPQDRPGRSGACRGRAGRLARAPWAAPAGAPPSPGRPALPGTPRPVPLAPAQCLARRAAARRGRVTSSPRGARFRTRSGVIPEAAEAANAESSAFAGFLPFPPFSTVLCRCGAPSPHGPLARPHPLGGRARLLGRRPGSAWC